MSPKYIFSNKTAFFKLIENITFWKKLIIYILPAEKGWKSKHVKKFSQP